MSQIDIRALADNASKIAFDLGGQATVTATINVGGGTYDPASDTKPAGATYTGIKGFLYQTMDQKLAEDSSKTGTILFRFSDVTAAGFTGEFSDGDTVVINGVTWTVYRVDDDPVRATAILKIRK